MRTPIFPCCRWPALLAAIALLAGPVSAQSPAAPAAPARPAAAMPASADGAAGAQRGLSIANKVWKGDFDKMLERRMIRVYAPYSRSLYFTDKGRERGLAAELVRDFERFLNQKHAKALGKRPLTIYIVPATRDKLLPDVEQGLADIAIGNLTITEERLKLVDFAGQDERRTMSEVVVTGPRTPAIATLDDLAGRQVHVRRASSYHDSLQLLNARFRKEGKPEMTLVLVPDSLEDEDMMEMLNTGLFELLVVGSFSSLIRFMYWPMR